MREEGETLENLVAKGLSLLELRTPYDRKRFVTPSEAAQAEFAKALQIDPDCYAALLGLGRCYSFRPRRYADAVEMFNRAAELCPDCPEPHYQIGLTMLHAGERGLKPGDLEPYEHCVKSLERALELGFAPMAEIYNALGTVHFRMGQYHNAVKWFRQSYDSLTVEGGWQPSTFFLAAEAYEKLGDFAEAIKWYQLYKQHAHLNDEPEIDERIEDLRRSMS